MAKKRILIVDDDPKMRKLLETCFSDGGISSLHAATAQEALDILASTKPDLITLDLNLGQDDGLDLAREIRQSCALPIVMVTGKGDVIDRIVGLELGADDYITKPFHVREVMARIKAVLRRADTEKKQATADPVLADDPTFHFAGWIAKPSIFELKKPDGKDQELTSAEFKLLQVFLERPKRILSREQLMDLVGGPEWSPLDRTIDNQIARLRKKIEQGDDQPFIKTVRGVGYSFAVDVIKK